MEVIKPYLGLLADLVTVVGLPFLIWSLLLLVRQLRVQAYQTVYESILSIDQFFTANPELIGYVLNGKPLPHDDSIERDKAVNAIGMWFDFLEHLVGQKSLLAKDVWKGWEIYIKELYEKNPALQAYIQENHRWYSDRLVDVIGFKRPSQPGISASRK